MLSRRQFVIDCSKVAALTLVPAAGLSRSLPLEEVALHDLSLATFAEHLHSTFRVRMAQDKMMDLELVKAGSLPLRAARQANGVANTWEAFSLIFRGLPDEAITQDTYCFEHSRLGRFRMFIVPLGSLDAREPRYQAVFNRAPRK
jgi:hypothetical protein